MRIANTSKLKQFVLLFTLITLSVVFTACTKEREEKFPDAIADNMIEKQQLLNARMTITTGNIINSNENKLLAANQGNIVEVERADGDSRFLEMFAPNKEGKLKIYGEANTSYPVVFKTDERNITAYKVVNASEKANLAVIEQAYIEDNKELSQGNDLLIPIFQFKIKEQGVPVLVKDPNTGENTSVRRLKATKSKDATHLLSTLVATFRNPIIVADKDQKELYDSKAVEEKLYNKKEIEEFLQTKLAFTHENDDKALFTVKILDGNAYIYSLTNQESINSEMKKSLKHDLKSSGIQACTKENIKSILAFAAKNNQNTLASKDSCVSVHRATFAVSYVKAHRGYARKGANSGDRGNTLNVIPQTKPSRLIQIKLKPDVAHNNFGETVNPERLLPVDGLKNKEYFFRKALTNSPSTSNIATLNYLVTIVKFVFNDNTLEIVQADDIKPKPGISKDPRLNKNEKEIIFSFPVEYFVYSNVDEKGKRLPYEKLIKANKNTKGALAQIDWSANTIDHLKFSYINQGCFANPTNKQFYNFVIKHKGDNKANKVEMLNLSVDTTLEARKLRCIRTSNSFFHTQTNYTFSERFSFLEYTKPSEKFTTVDLPYRAHKKFGFGVIQSAKQKPSRDGILNNDKDYEYRNLVFDFWDNQKLTYVLVGLPESGAEESIDGEREIVIEAANEVVASLNKDFKRAFKDTPLERSGNYVELKIKGIDKEVENVFYGDMNYNFIQYDRKIYDLHGSLGVYLYSSDPRTGRSVNGNVVIYGGALINYTKRLKEHAHYLADYREMVGKPFHSFTNPMLTEAERKQEDTRGEINATSRDTIMSSVSNASGMNIYQEMQLQLEEQAKNSLIDLMPDMASFTNADSIKNFQFQGKFAELYKEELESFRSFKEAKSTADYKHSLLAKMNPMQAEFDESQGKLKDKSHLNHAKCQLGMHAGGLSPALSPAASGDYIVDFTKTSKEDIFKYQLRYTIHHELLHASGLQHNFFGHYDKENFKFDDEDENDKRMYSSIMDYPNSDVNYHGAGPYDIAALRYAYTGLIEANKEFASNVRQAANAINSPIVKKHDHYIGNFTTGQRFTLYSGKFLNVNELISSFNPVDNRNDLSFEFTRTLPLKRYRYCNTEDQRSNILCGAFNVGTTPKEVIDNHIERYFSGYVLRNLPNDRNQFDIIGRGGFKILNYIARIQSSFLTIRQFLEEYFYTKIVLGAEHPLTKQMREATLASHNFFHSIIRTPDAPEYILEENMDPISRFQILRSSDGRQVLPVERKWLRTRLLPGDRRIRVIGHEYDKAFALMMLTETGLFADTMALRNQSRSLNFSYVDFEKDMLASLPEGDPSKDSEPATIGLVKEILMDQVTPAVRLARGMQIIPVPELKVDITSFMQITALRTAVFGFERQRGGFNNNGLFESNADDFGILMSSEDAPEGHASIQLADGFNYFAAKKESFATMMLNKANKLRYVYENIEGFLKNFSKYLNSRNQLAAWLNENVPATEDGLMDENTSKAIVEAYENMKQDPIIMIALAAETGQDANDVDEATEDTSIDGASEATKQKYTLFKQLETLIESRKKFNELLAPLVVDRDTDYYDVEEIFMNITTQLNQFAQRSQQIQQAIAIGQASPATFEQFVENTRYRNINNAKKFPVLGLIKSVIQTRIPRWNDTLPLGIVPRAIQDTAESTEVMGIFFGISATGSKYYRNNPNLIRLTE